MFKIHTVYFKSFLRTC